jgi:HAD superfamily hydrolase (TIGR01549 family)
VAGSAADSSSAVVAVTVLLDLDDTLVLTSALAELRRARRWADVYAGFGQTTVPAGTADFVEAVLALGQAGVVTTSPRTYAERLLRYHGIALPVLVAYHDCPRRKPDPAPLLMAAERLSVEPSTCFHVGDQPSDDAAAVAAGMRSILVAWSDPKSGHAHSWSDVLAQLRA